MIATAILFVYRDERILCPDLYKIFEVGHKDNTDMGVWCVSRGIRLIDYLRIPGKRTNLLHDPGFKGMTPAILLSFIGKLSAGCDARINQDTIHGQR